MSSKHSQVSAGELPDSQPQVELREKIVDILGKVEFQKRVPESEVKGKKVGGYAIDYTTEYAYGLLVDQILPLVEAHTAQAVESFAEKVNEANNPPRKSDGSREDAYDRVQELVNNVLLTETLGKKGEHD